MNKFEKLQKQNPKLEKELNEVETMQKEFIKSIDEHNNNINEIDPDAQKFYPKNYMILVKVYKDVNAAYHTLKIHEGGAKTVAYKSVFSPYAHSQYGIVVNSDDKNYKAGDKVYLKTNQIIALDETGDRHLPVGALLFKDLYLKGYILISSNLIEGVYED